MDAGSHSHACATSVGGVCHCDCHGAEHGIAHLPKGPKPHLTVSKRDGGGYEVRRPDGLPPGGGTADERREHHAAKVKVKTVDDSKAMTAAGRDAAAYTHVKAASDAILERDRPTALKALDDGEALHPTYKIDTGDGNPIGWDALRKVVTDRTPEEGKAARDARIKGELAARKVKLDAERQTRLDALPQTHPDIQKRILGYSVMIPENVKGMPREARESASAGSMNIPFGRMDEHGNVYDPEGRLIGRHKQGVPQPAPDTAGWVTLDTNVPAAMTMPGHEHRDIKVWRPATASTDRPAAPDKPPAAKARALHSYTARRDAVREHGKLTRSQFDELPDDKKQAILDELHTAANRGDTHSYRGGMGITVRGAAADHVNTAKALTHRFTMKIEAPPDDSPAGRTKRLRDAKTPAEARAALYRATKADMEQIARDNRWGYSSGWKADKLRDHLIASAGQDGVNARAGERAADVKVTAAQDVSPGAAPGATISREEAYRRMHGDAVPGSPRAEREAYARGLSDDELRATGRQRSAALQAAIAAEIARRDAKRRG